MVTLASTPNNITEARSSFVDVILIVALSQHCQMNKKWTDSSASINNIHLYHDVSRVNLKLYDGSEV